MILARAKTAQGTAGPDGWALVTGASEGLGREFALIAARAGHPVILSARQEDKLNALAEEPQPACPGRGDRGRSFRRR